MTHHKHPPPKYLPDHASLAKRGFRAVLALIRILILTVVLRLGIEFANAHGWLSKLGHAEEFVLAAVTNHVMFEVWEE